MKINGHFSLHLHCRTTVMVWLKAPHHNWFIILHAWFLSSGKTSLLFQHAISCAEQGQRVLFLSPSPLKQLPLLSSDYKQSQPHPSTLERIHLRYAALMIMICIGVHPLRTQQKLVIILSLLNLVWIYIYIQLQNILDHFREYCVYYVEWEGLKCPYF